MRKFGKRPFDAFTLAELIVVVVVLAVLATVGFLALSGYSSDARDSALKANVRSVSVAISAESASTGNSPRYYVIHDAGAALSGASVYVDGNPVALSGGNWDVAGTNYSAGNPDYAKLKLNPDKFKVASAAAPAYAGLFAGFASAAYDPKYLTVGAADVLRTVDGKKRPSGWYQVAGISPSTSSVSVSGNYPAGLSGSVAGLVLDPTSGSSTGALVDGAKAWVSTGCASGTVNGYSVPALAHLGTAAVTKAVLSGTGFNIGTKTGNASCSFGTANAADVSISCAAGYVEGAGLSCVADVCGGTVSDPNAHSTATSQTVSLNWARSATPGACTWDCNSGYGWDSGTNSCKANCLASAQTVNGRSYSVPAFNNGSTVSASSSSSLTGGTQAYSQNFSCSNGTVSTSGAETAGAITCSADFALNASACVPVSCRAQKTAYPSSTSMNYPIDPDGAGGNAPFTAYCDMSTDNGGWTLVFYSNSDNVPRSSVSASDWNAGPSINFSRLWSMRNIKNASGLYEFYVKDSSAVGRYVIFTQTNAYHQNPVGNSYVKKSGNFYYSSQTNGSTWYGLALGNYGNSSNQSSCTLSMAYEWQGWTYCLQDQLTGSYNTGPWFYDISLNTTSGYDPGSQQWVQVYQR